VSQWQDGGKHKMGPVGFYFSFSNLIQGMCCWQDGGKQGCALLAYAFLLKSGYGVVASKGCVPMARK